MNVVPDHSVKFYYKVVEHNVTNEFYCHITDTKYMIIEAAKHYANRISSEKLKDFPLTFTLYNQDMKYIGLFLVEIDGWTPEFNIVAKT